MRDSRGQMTVELAVLIPVVVVMALVIHNLAGFVSACAAFDRIALDAVISQGVSPAGEQTDLGATEAVSSCISQALGREGTCSVEVRAERLTDASGSYDFSVAPLLTRYVCTLVYRPWPSSFSIAGVAYRAPVELRHERSIVVDRYRPGVVI